MAFDFGRRTALLDKWANNTEKRGSKEHAKFIDLPVSFAINEADLDMLIPVPQAEAGETPFVRPVEFFFDADNNLIVTALSDLALARTPEGLEVTIWHDPEDARKHMTIPNVRASKVSLALKSGETLGTVKMSLRIPVTPEQRDRFWDLEHVNRDIEIRSTQDDLFEAPAPKEEPETPEKQVDIEDEPETEAPAKAAEASSNVTSLSERRKKKKVSKKKAAKKKTQPAND